MQISEASPRAQPADGPGSRASGARLALRAHGLCATPRFPKTLLGHIPASVLIL